MHNACEALFQGALPVNVTGLQALRADSVHQEVESAAQQVCTLVENGCRYRDISIVCADMGAYGDLLKQGDVVCNCHIPSSGALLGEDVLASLKMAYDFYPQYRRNGILPITCNSWLLYPPVAELFKEGSNLDRFYKIFEILKTKEQEHNSDFWRIFNLPFSEENLQNAPENSSLQRSIKAFLQAGNHLGAGLGIILFDGENILTQR